MHFDLTQAKDGVLLIDKPAGWTSFDVVAKIRSQIRAEYRARGEKPTKRQLRVGHTGTLDPFATGLLIILLGDATKRSDEFLKLDKVYEATIHLGQTSATGDPEGEISDVSSRLPGIEEVKSALEQLTGDIRQRPPIYSAIKIDGKRAYKLAREGKEVEMPLRTVTIYSIELLDYTYPELKIRTHVSSGTYIRTLAEDIGRVLGAGAYCSQLRRTQVGKAKLENAMRLEQSMPRPTFAIDPHGAYVTELSSGDRPILFTRTHIDGKLRGGSHVCLPNFGPDEAGVLAQHGFGRTEDWELVRDQPDVKELVLPRGPGVYADLKSRLRYTLSTSDFTMQLTLHATGTEPLRVAPAFHPYFASPEDEEVYLDGERCDLSQYAGTEYTSGPTHELRIGNRTFVLHSDQLTTWALWTDQAGRYFCIEPSLIGQSFRHIEPHSSELLPPGEVRSYEFRVGWS